MINDFESKNRGVAISFSDISLVPQNSDVSGRELVDLATTVAGFHLSHPIMPTNMSTITGLDMMNHLSFTNGIAFCHRFMSELELEAIIHSHLSYREDNGFCNIPTAFSIGVKKEDHDWIKHSISIMPESITKNMVVLIDIAHGDSKYVLDTVKIVKDYMPNSIKIIGGNVATGEGFARLVNAGVDGVRVGISGGSVCTTKYVTGHGVPTLASVMDCAKTRDALGVHEISIIADGGITNSGDIVKSLAFGADAVCIGRLLSGSSLTPGNIIEVDGKKYKEYYGMSSHIAQDRHKGGLRRGIAAEGIDVLVPYAGDTEKILSKLIGGVQSGLAYSGAYSIQELRENFEYVTLGAGGISNKNNNWN